MNITKMIGKSSSSQFAVHNGSCSSSGFSSSIRGVAPSPPSPEEEEDFFAWAKQAAAWATPMEAPETDPPETQPAEEPEEERGSLYLAIWSGR